MCQINNPQLESLNLRVSIRSFPFTSMMPSFKRAVPLEHQNTCTTVGAQLVTPSQTARAPDRHVCSRSSGQVEIENVTFFAFKHVRRVLLLHLVNRICSLPRAGCQTGKRERETEERAPGPSTKLLEKAFAAECTKPNSVSGGPLVRPFSLHSFCSIMKQIELYFLGMFGCCAEDFCLISTNDFIRAIKMHSTLVESSLY